MPFCRLMGIELPVFRNPTTVDTFRAGSFSWSFNGTPRASERAERSVYAGTTPLTLKDTSLAYQRLVSGLGQAWRFAGNGTGSSAALTSTKGLSASSVGASTQSFTTGGPVAGRVLVLSTESVTWSTSSTAPDGNVAISVWARADDGTLGVWQHFLLHMATGDTSPADAAAAWVDGVSTSPAGLRAFLSYNGTTGALSLLAPNAPGPVPEDWEFAELMVLPFHGATLDSTWPDWLYNSGSGRLAENLRYLTLEGDWADESSVQVLGEVGKRTQQYGAAGSYALYDSFDFTLMQKE